MCTREAVCNFVKRALERMTRKGGERGKNSEKPQARLCEELLGVDKRSHQMGS